MICFSDFVLWRGQLFLSEGDGGFLMQDLPDIREGGFLSYLCNPFFSQLA